MRDIDSTPAATTTSWWPAWIAAAALSAACIEEPHWRSTVVAATVSGQPATSTATRPTFSACSPIWVTQPICTSSISPGSRSRRATRPFSTPAARSSARTDASAPLRRPIGERTASTINASRTRALLVACGVYHSRRHGSRPCALYAPTRACSVGGLRNTSPRTTVLGRDGSRATPGRRSSTRATAICASSRARCMPRQTCGPLREREVVVGVGTPHVEAVGILEHGRISVGACKRHRDQVAPGDCGAAELDVARRVAVDDRRRRLEPQRFLDGALRRARARPGRAPAAPGVPAGAARRSRSSPRSSRCRRRAAPRRSTRPAHA